MPVYMLGWAFGEADERRNEGGWVRGRTPLKPPPPAVEEGRCH